MQIVCPKCQRVIVGDDLDVRSRLAVCRPCGEVVSLSPLGTEEADDAVLARYRPDSLRWTEEKLASSFCARTSPPRVSALVFLLPLFLAGAFWFTSAGHGKPAPTSLSAAILAFMAAIFVHRVLAALFNTSNVRLDLDAFVVAKGPIPEGRAVVVPTASIAAFVKAAEVKPREDGDSAASWYVNVLTRDGEAVRALHLAAEDSAAFVAERLNAELERIRHTSPSQEPYR